MHIMLCINITTTVHKAFLYSTRRLSLSSLLGMQAIQARRRKKEPNEQLEEVKAAAAEDEDNVPPSIDPFTAYFYDEEAWQGKKDAKMW